MRKIGPLDKEEAKQEHMIKELIAAGGSDPDRHARRGCW